MSYCRKCHLEPPFCKCDATSEISIASELVNTKKELTQERERVKELRGMLTESVCKECKCKQNVEVKMEIVERNLELKEAQAQHIDYVNGLHEKIRGLEGELVEYKKALLAENGGLREE